MFWGGSKYYSNILTRGSIFRWVKILYDTGHTYYRTRRKGTKSIRSQVNSYTSQFVLIWSTRTHFSVNSYSYFFFRLIRTHLVSSYSFRLIRPHFGQSVLILKLANYEGNIERKINNHVVHFCKPKRRRMILKSHYENTPIQIY